MIVIYLTTCLSSLSSIHHIASKNQQPVKHVAGQGCSIVDHDLEV